MFVLLPAATINFYTRSARKLLIISLLIAIIRKEKEKDTPTKGTKEGGKR